MKRSHNSLFSLGGVNRLICIGFQRWKAYSLRPFLVEAFGDKVYFVASCNEARRLKLSHRDAIAVWGCFNPVDIQELVIQTGCRLFHIEDGFYRSIGLGSDLIAPRSLVIDCRGIYFDPRRPSDLEVQLNSCELSSEDLNRAKFVRELITRHRLTKYNIESRNSVTWQNHGRRVILVPGQVDGDASVHFGSLEISTNMQLLLAVRNENPDAFIVYKPHPDVSSGNRRGRLDHSVLDDIVDLIAQTTSVIPCIEAVDEVHTMTSQSGFDALLHGKKVVTYGVPFYAGWGLTEDRATNVPALARRRRKLTIDEFISVTLLKYPLYWDPALGRIVDCEVVLNWLAANLQEMELAGELSKLRRGGVPRLMRKLSVILPSIFSRK